MLKRLMIHKRYSPVRVKLSARSAKDNAGWNLSIKLAFNFSFLISQHFPFHKQFRDNFGICIFCGEFIVESNLSAISSFYHGCKERRRKGRKKIHSKLEIKIVKLWSISDLKSIWFRLYYKIMYDDSKFEFTSFLCISDANDIIYIHIIIMSK